MYNESTKVKLDVFRELRIRLNKRCKEDCPCYIRADFRARITDKISLDMHNVYCGICRVEFNFINGKYNWDRCPCQREPNPEELFLRLDEYIEELEENLSKEYSS